MAPTTMLKCDQTHSNLSSMHRLYSGQYLGLPLDTLRCVKYLKLEDIQGAGFESRSVHSFSDY
jgi:hypothetical protein